MRDGEWIINGKDWSWLESNSAENPIYMALYDGTYYKFNMNLSWNNRFMFTMVNTGNTVINLENVWYILRGE